MDVKILAAIISASISIAVAVISLYIAHRREESIVGRFQKEQSRDLALRIYDKRMEVYPEAFAITERLDRVRGITLDDKIKIFKEARDKLNEWHGRGPALWMSGKSIKTFYRLRTSLGKLPTNSGSFSDVQLENIRNCRSEFRLSLRTDIGILHESADSEI